MSWLLYINKHTLYSLYVQYCNHKHTHKQTYKTDKQLNQHTLYSLCGPTTYVHACVNKQVNKQIKQANKLHVI